MAPRSRRINPVPLLTFVLLTPLVLLLSLPLSLRAAQTEVLQGLEWRLIGPWRGGRVTAVTGVADNPLLYYMGATGGGVWKTENAGTTWENLSDGFFKVGTIGAIAVAESDHNVLYVGTGEAPIRGVTTSHGDGMWKSEDAGRTWTHIGLDRAGQIAKIEIHPDNPDVAWVAVQGQIWAPNEERGVYRTTDGGETWEHVLKINDRVGATDLSLDPSNPRILYAAMWNHGRKPWFIHSGGRDGGIFKSVDGGETWEKLGGGLPEMVGKIGVDVSAANPDRVYAIIEAEPEKGGLYRSDDAGKTWKLMNGHRVLHSRAWYYIHLAADPVDENTVYVLNVPLMKSIDGGSTWEKLTTPHSDHHDHWINPFNSQNMINGNDGGATITFDGGDTWSSIENQPTAQFYRVTTDNQVPFRIYGGQQDNTTVSIASETWDGGIGVEDYFPVGGGESAHIAFDPDDPRLIYATTINGTLTEYDHALETTRYIIPYPVMVYGKDSKDLKYRANWNTPVAVSPHDPSVIYYGAQMVLRSEDRGATWTEISPDLTRNDPQKQGRNGGPLTPENVGAEFYNTLFYIVESSLEPGVIWVGSDDGLVHITHNGGEGWENISPRHDGEAMINSIELSPHDAATAYLAVTGYKLNDFRPYIYKTTDHGKRWKRIDEGLPGDTFVRVVREDPMQRGVLYAGTEAGMFVSFNDGDDWQPLQLNLPPVPITDLAIRHDKLVAATQGRAFWVLDSLSVVREAGAGLEGPLHVFSPGTVKMVSGGGSAGNWEGSNPERGVPVYYWLSDDLGGQDNAALSVEILDASGAVVRRYDDREGDFERCRLGNMDPRRPFTIDYPTADAGLNKWTWDFRGENLPCVDNIALFAGFGGATVTPGNYSVRVSVNGAQQTVPFSLVPDPRNTASGEEISEWASRLQETAGLLSDVLTRLRQAREARRQVEALMAGYPDQAELQGLSEQAISRIDAWDAEINQVKHQTYEDEDGWETKLAGQVRFLFDVIDETGAPVTEGALERLSDLQAEWRQRQSELRLIRAETIEPINRWAAQQDLPHIGGARTFD